MESWLSVIYVLFDCIIVASCQYMDDSFEPNHPSVKKFDSQSFRSERPFQYVVPRSVESDIPMILWWTERLHTSSGVQQLNCPNSVCYSTKERRYINDPRTYGFYFYGTDLDPEDMPFPRKPHHEWALFHEESPMNNYMLVHNTMLKLFNHTCTFRRESDYPITSNALDSLDYLTKRKSVSIQEKNNARKEGLAPVLFIQSHCNVASDRERYMSELMKHIKVDSVGQCLHNKDLPESLRDPVDAMFAPGLYDLISKYKFHIAYENAICQDYMTEKLFRPLHVGSVPVYKGSNKARDWMPNNKSIIMIDDFSSPEELATVLKELDEDDDEYESYLKYKDEGVTNKFLKDHFRDREWGVNEIGKPDSLISFECYVCDRLTERYNREVAHRANPDIPLLPRRMANSSHLNCPQPYPSYGHLQDLPEDDTWLEQYWIEDYWSGLEKAEVLTELIENNEKHPSMFRKYFEKKMQDSPPLPHQRL